MEESVRDSTAEEQDDSATLPALGAAARESLARGQAVTISHNGRTLRVHPDGRLEELVAVTLGRLALGAASDETVVPMIPNLTPSTLAKFDLPKVDIPLAFREIAETVAALANASFENPTDAAPTTEIAGSESAAGQPADEDTDQRTEEISTADLEAMEGHTGTLATTTAGATEYGLKFMEAACINANAMIQFANVLLQAKSLSEMVVLSTAHARKQIETVTEQTKQLAVAAQKMAPKNTDPVDATSDDVDTSEV
jgi:hypothetical protein